MVLVKSGLNSTQASLMRHIYTEKCVLVMKQAVLTVRMVLILSDLYTCNGTLLYMRGNVYS